MTLRTLIRRSLRFHWRSHLGVVLGAVIGSAALIGALVVGDSVRGSLRERALERLRGVHFALATHDRLFSDELGQRICAAENYRQIWPLSSNLSAGFVHLQPVAALNLNGMVANVRNQSRANQVNILGVSLYVRGDAQGKWLGDFENIDPGQIWINQLLAEQLHASVGDEVLLRIPKPGGLSDEISISPRNGHAVSMRLKVIKILTPSEYGNFNPHPGKRATFNAFVNLRELQRVVDLPDKANQLFVSEFAFYRKEKGTPISQLWNRMVTSGPDWLRDGLRTRYMGGTKRVFDYDGVKLLPLTQTRLAAGWKLEDVQAELRRENDSNHLDLITERIFLDEPVKVAALKATSDGNPILTYLATLLRSGTNATPYSMVTAAGSPWTPPDLRDDEIVVSRWLAEDLHVKPGDEIALSYFLPESGAKLEEATNTFRVHSIVPMAMPWADRTLMPDFPGIEKAESTSEWDAGFPLTYEIRKKDDDYWKQYRGTPKAFVTLAAGQKMWGNRFGNLTAIRFPIPSDFVGDEVTSLKSSANTGETNQSETPHVVSYKAALEKRILANLKPEELGLRFEPVREQALAAAEGSQDFGGLFLGFSFFVIGAALLLMAMLFRFGLEQRASEIGTLLALGFMPAQVRKLFLREGIVLAFIGGVIGAVGGIYYAKAMIRGLSTIWRDAVGATALSFHVTAQTLVIGVLASVVVSAITIWLVLRKFVKRAPRELLVGENQGEESEVSSLKAKVIAVATLVGALGLVGWALASGETANAGAFFGAGALVLIAGLAFVHARLGRLSHGDSITHTSLAVRSCARRRKRSLATIAMLACGSFLIASIGVFRLDANRDATQRSSGTGGFALIGETTMPVVHDLNSQSGRDFFALDEKDLNGVNVVPFRVRAGDEASCLNLNAAQKPRLLGLKPEMMEKRFSFSKISDPDSLSESWNLLKSKVSAPPTSIKFFLFYSVTTFDLTEDAPIPAIGDANSIQWAMKKKVGDTIDYVDERGQPFKVRIVGAVANSILQGQLIIDEAEFVKRFPGESGYRMFLVDAPSNAVSQVSATLSRAMQDVGLELTPTAVRLNQFNAVQNTYLGTFQVLGGLGLLLGSVGLGIVVLRNVLERRGELAVLMAVGFRKRQVQRLLFIENGALLLAGLALGIVAAAVAVLPALLSASDGLPITSLAVTLGAVLLNGVVWTWAATQFAVRGDLLNALRNE